MRWRKHEQNNPLRQSVNINSSHLQTKTSVWKMKRHECAIMEMESASIIIPYQGWLERNLPFYSKCWFKNNWQLVYHVHIKFLYITWYVQKQNTSKQKKKDVYKVTISCRYRRYREPFYTSTIRWILTTKSQRKHEGPLKKSCKIIK